MLEIDGIAIIGDKDGDDVAIGAFDGVDVVGDTDGGFEGDIVGNEVTIGEIDGGLLGNIVGDTVGSPAIFLCYQ